MYISPPSKALSTLFSQKGPKKLIPQAMKARVRTREAQTKKQRPPHEQRQHPILGECEGGRES